MDRKRPPIGPFLLAVDGRSSSGKSTLAERIAALLPGTAIVHTDDVAWWHSRFGWDDLLLAGIIEPLRRGEAVDYRPPAWDARGRPGSITVPADAELVVIEGVGAGRASLAERVDAVIWVQSDLDITERRNRDRVETGELDLAGYEGWMSEEVRFRPPSGRGIAPTSSSRVPPLLTTRCLRSWYCGARGLIALPPNAGCVPPP